MFRKFKMLFAFAVMAMIVVSCAQQEDAFEPDPNVVAKIVDGKMKLQYGDLQIREVFAEDYDGADKVEEWNLEQAGSHYYLMARGTKPGTNFSLLTAIELTRIGNDLALDYSSPQAREKHSCMGQDCNCCAFFRDSTTNEIIGCHCDRSQHGGCVGTLCLHGIEEIIEDPEPPGDSTGGDPMEDPMDDPMDDPMGDDSTGGEDPMNDPMDDPMGGDSTGGDSTRVPNP